MISHRQFVLMIVCCVAMPLILLFPFKSGSRIFEAPDSPGNRLVLRSGDAEYNDDYLKRNGVEYFLSEEHFHAIVLMTRIAKRQYSGEERESLRKHYKKRLVTKS
jgi:hypothetical protein